MNDHVSRRGFSVAAVAARVLVLQDSTSAGRVYDPGRAGRAMCTRVDTARHSENERPVSCGSVTSMSAAAPTDAFELARRPLLSQRMLSRPARAGVVHAARARAVLKHSTRRCHGRDEKSPSTHMIVHAHLEFHGVSSLRALRSPLRPALIRHQARGTIKPPITSTNPRTNTHHTSD